MLQLDGTARAEALNRGEGHFFDLACWRCHALGRASLPGIQDHTQLGPDLADIGSRLDPDLIHQSIIDPNAAIAEPSADHTNEAGLSFMPPFDETVDTEALHELVFFLSQQQTVSRREASPSNGVPVSLATEITQSTFAKEVLQSRSLVLLDFWAEWCLPCLELEPLLEKMAATFGSQLKLCKINVDENTELVAEYVPDNIFPCLILLRDGKVLDRRYGTDPKMEPEAFLRSWIQQHLESGAGE